MTFDPLDWLDDELDQLTHQHVRRRATIRSSGQGTTIDLDGQRLINFGSNDYLGLAADPRLVAAVTDSANRQGFGSGASPLVTGRTESQAALECELAAFEQTEAALVFPSGFAANVGTITSLARRGDLIVSDAKNHASLIDACRLSRADVRVYRHADVAHVRELLGNCASYPRRFIITDTLFSMDGDLAPLADLVELTLSHRAILIADEAHATGVFGAHGRGVGEVMGVEPLMPVRIGTLSKALGSVGGFVAGQRRLVEWLFNRARPFVFSTALPAACHEAARTALRIVRSEPQRREQLRDNSDQLRRALAEQGWNVGRSASQIIPIVLGDPQQTMRMADRLRRHGLLVPGIRPPTVPRGESLLRVSLSAAHTQSDQGQLLAALAQASTAGAATEAPH